MRSSRRLEPGSESKVRKSSARRVDDKVLFERLWKGTFQAIVAASLQARGGGHRKGTTLRSVISVKESHQMAEANQEKNLKMREALGISQYFVEGSSLDPARKAKEAAAAEEAKKKYALIPDSSSSSPERTQEKEKVKKRKKKKPVSTHEKLDSVSSAKKKKSSKKHKKDRSVSPEHHKKKKSKKTSKDKLKHKSKKSRTRSSSSSSVVSSSSSADDESSSRSSSVSSLSDAQSDGSSYERHKHSSKADRNPKTYKKHSLSPESALYTKDSRSRKDLYEAKKGKHKRKSGRSPTTSTSEDDSSPKQYYRLEPVLLKSKTKHKKTRQFIEVPKKSTYELKKKKRVYDSSTSSSSSSGTKSKSRSKCRKRSSSPDVSKASKYHFSRNEDTPKRMDSSKSSKRHPKSSCSPEEKMRSPEILHKSKHKKNIPEDGSRLSRRSKNKTYDDKNGGKYHKSSDKHLYKRTCSTSPEKSHAKKKHESPKKRKDGKKSPKHRHPATKLERKDKNYSESPQQHRSHKTSSESLSRYQGRNSKSPSRHNGRSRSPSVVSGYSPGGPSSFSPFNEERFFTRSPSPKYKHKKHILNESPPYSSQTISKNKISPKSSQKSTARAVISGRSTSRSVSPDGYYHGKSKQRHSTSPQVSSTKKVSQKRQSPNVRKRSKSRTSSPELDAKQRKVYGDRSHSSSASSSTPDVTQNPFPWKSKGEMKDGTVQSKNLCVSPKEISLKSSRNSPLKVNMSPDRKSPKTFEKSPPATNSLPNADVFQTMPNSVKRKLDDQQGTTEDTPNKIIKLSPGRNRNSNSDNEKIFFNMKAISIPHPPVEEKSAVEISQARTEKVSLCPQDSENVNSSEKKAKGGLSKSKDPKRSKSPELRAIKEGSHSRSRSTSAAHSCSASDRSSSYSKSHSYSRSKSRSKSFSRSRSKSYSRSRSRSVSLSSRSRSRSYSSRSRSRSIARSPSIPRRRGSPSFLDKRRITSARKRPVPYRRPSPPTPSSSEEGSSWSYRSVTPSSASSPRSYNSPIQATPFIHSFDNRV